MEAHKLTRLLTDAHMSCTCACLSHMREYKLTNKRAGARQNACVSWQAAMRIWRVCAKWVGVFICAKLRCIQLVYVFGMINECQQRIASPSSIVDGVVAELLMRYTHARRCAAVVHFNAADFRSKSWSVYILYTYIVFMGYVFNLGNVGYWFFTYIQTDGQNVFPLLIRITSCGDCWFYCSALMRRVNGRASVMCTLVNGILRVRIDTYVYKRGRKRV